mgnify:CR=1 FL=1
MCGPFARAIAEGFGLDPTPIGSKPTAELRTDLSLCQITLVAEDGTRYGDSTTDVLGKYEVTADSSGEVEGYRRLERYVRGQAEGAS